ncbi:hypothetical protein HZU73_09393 [Apis mellifera caucasica]|nr:hypothetical protein HZU73_09393 [Apis mellifera caucasica]KAG9428336.1 hypothetical protein HZU67_09739 [Apis mellifera carnica]
MTRKLNVLLLLKKVQFLEDVEKLIKEGKNYLFRMNKLSDSLRIDSYQYKKILYFMDRYSRCKTQLKENMEELKDMFDNSNIDGIIDEEETDEENEIEYIEDEDFLLEEQFYHFRNIMYLKNILGNMEMLISRMLNINGSLVNLQLSKYARLKIALKNYSVKVYEFLKNNKILVESKNNFEKKQFTKNIQDKFIQLQKLIIQIAKKEIFFTDVMVRNLHDISKQRK